jgi:protein subunit release factor A
MNTLIIEIRAGEGGDDAKLFTQQMASAYCKLADRMGWTHCL